MLIQELLFYFRHVSFIMTIFFLISEMFETKNYIKIVQMVFFFLKFTKIVLSLRY